MGGIKEVLNQDTETKRGKGEVLRELNTFFIKIYSHVEA